MAPTDESSHPTLGVTIAGTLDETGAVQADTDTAAQTLTIAYDPASGTYTLYRPDGEKTFPDRQLTDSTTPNIVYGEYVNTLADGQENLIVTLPPSDATDSLNWVGHGIYFSLLQQSNGTFAVEADAFHYGFATAGTDVPTTGEATYSVAVLGFLTEEGQNPILLKTGNPGLLVADFGLGTVNVDGIVDGFDVVSGNAAGNFQYLGDATIGADGFDGTFELGGIAGTWDGLFYGPAAQEVGASFRGSTGPVDYIGSLVGSSDPGFRNIAQSFIGLNDPASFEPFLVEELEMVTEDGDTISSNFFFPGPATGGLLGNYNVSYRDPGVWSLANTFTYSDSDIDSARSNDQWTFYGDNDPAGGSIDGLQLLNSGPGNSLIELTYTKLGIWARGGNGGGDYEIARRYAAFGFRTDEADVPTTGSASYTGVVIGAGKSEGTDSRFYDLSGSANIAVRFDSNEWDGVLTLSGQDRADGSTRDFGIFGSQVGVLTGAELTETALLDAGVDVGSIFGYLFGPLADEVAGGFLIDMDDPARAGHRLDLKGVFAGKKD